MSEHAWLATDSRVSGYAHGLADLLRARISTPARQLLAAVETALDHIAVFVEMTFERGWAPSYEPFATRMAIWSPRSGRVKVVQGQSARPGLRPAATAGAYMRQRT